MVTCHRGGDRTVWTFSMIDHAQTTCAQCIVRPFKTTKCLSLVQLPNLLHPSPASRGRTWSLTQHVFLQLCVCVSVCLCVCVSIVPSPHSTAPTTPHSGSCRAAALRKERRQRSFQRGQRVRSGASKAWGLERHAPALPEGAQPACEGNLQLLLPLPTHKVSNFTALVPATRIRLGEV